MARADPGEGQIKSITSSSLHPRAGFGIEAWEQAGKPAAARRAWGLALAASRSLCAGPRAPSPLYIFTLGHRLYTV